MEVKQEFKVDDRKTWEDSLIEVAAHFFAEEKKFTIALAQIALKSYLSNDFSVKILPLMTEHLETLQQSGGVGRAKDDGCFETITRCWDQSRAALLKDIEEGKSSLDPEGKEKVGLNKDRRSAFVKSVLAVGGSKAFQPQESSVSIKELFAKVLQLEKRVQQQEATVKELRDDNKELRDDNKQLHEKLGKLQQFANSAEAIAAAKNAAAGGKAASETKGGDPPVGEPFIEKISAENGKCALRVMVLMSKHAPAPDAKGDMDKLIADKFPTVLGELKAYVDKMPDEEVRTLWRGSSKQEVKAKFDTADYRFGHLELEIYQMISEVDLTLFATSSAHLQPFEAFVRRPDKGRVMCILFEDRGNPKDSHYSVFAVRVGATIARVFTAKDKEYDAYKPLFIELFKPYHTAWHSKKNAKWAKEEADRKRREAEQAAAELRKKGDKSGNPSKGKKPDSEKPKPKPKPSQSDRKQDAQRPVPAVVLRNVAESETRDSLMVQMVDLPVSKVKRSRRSKADSGEFVVYASQEGDADAVLEGVQNLGFECSKFIKYPDWEDRGRGRENDRGRGGHGRGGGDPGRGGWGRGRASKAAPKGDALAKHVELKQKEAVAIQQSAPQPPAVAAAVRPVLPVQQPVFHPWHPAQLAMPVQNPFGPFRGGPGGGGYGGGYAGGYGGAQPLCPEWHYRGCCQAGSGCAFFHPPFPLLH
jgi:cell division protein FtsB